MNIFQRFKVRPATGASMLKVPGDYKAEVELDISDLNDESLQALIDELQDLGLTVSENAGTLKVVGSVLFEYSRGTDNQGRRAIWISASGPIVEIIAQGLAFTYASKGWPLTAGRILREALVKVGSEVALPDRTIIFVGASDEYAASLLATDGSYVHPKLGDELKRLIADSDDVEIDDEDPFK